MKIKFLLIVLLFSFQAFAQCYDLGSKRKNYDSYFFVSAGADPIPTEKWINVGNPNFTTDGLDLLFKLGYGSDELLFVPIELYAYYERFNDGVSDTIFERINTDLCHRSFLCRA